MQQKTLELESLSATDQMKVTKQELLTTPVVFLAVVVVVVQAVSSVQLGLQYKELKIEWVLTY